jgi:hypothetical protein
LILERVVSIVLKRESIANRREFISDNILVGAEGEPAAETEREAWGEDIDAVMAQFTGDAGLASGMLLYTLRIYISETRAWIEIRMFMCCLSQSNQIVNDSEFINICPWLHQRQKFSGVVPS